MHSFTQRFVAYLKKNSAVDKPSDKVMIEYYTSVLGSEFSMFSKMLVEPTLSETYEEAEKESIEDYPEQSGEKNFW